MKYAPSAFGIGQLSGSSGGTTASHNRFGSYFRARTIPVNPNTPIQTLRRETLAGLSADWRTLTDAQRESWNSLALQISKTDALGVAYNPTGLQTYVGNNSLRIFAAALPLVDNAPILDSPPILTSVVGAATVDIGSVLDGFDVTFAPTPLGAGQRLAIYATGRISAGRSFIKASEFRLLEVTAAAAASPVDVFAEYSAIYGTDFAEGDKIVVKVVPISANFFRGAEVRDEIIVAGP